MVEFKGATLHHTNEIVIQMEFYEHLLEHANGMKLNPYQKTVIIHLLAKEKKRKEKVKVILY
jgi:hypothetical protein